MAPEQRIRARIAAELFRNEDETLIVDDALRSLLEAGELSDFKIRCRGREWAIHKFLFRHSTFFRGAFDGSFQEAKQGFVELHEEDPDALDQAIEWVYTRTGGLRTHSFRKQLLLCPKLYALAARLDLDAVARISAANFEKLARRFLDILCDIGHDDLSDLLLNWTEDVYNGTAASDNMLRDPLTRIVVNILRDDDWHPNKRIIIEEVFRKSAALAMDVSLELLNQEPWRSRTPVPGPAFSRASSMIIQDDYT